MAQITKVVIPSGGNEKLNATRDAFFKAGFDPKLVEFQQVKVPSSGIDEQPVKIEMGLIGASNRIKSGMAAVPDADYWIGLENTIVKVNYDGVDHWFDVGCVIVRRKDGKQAIAITAGIEFPAEMVEIAKQMGFETTTAGSVIAEAFKCNPKDPHTFLTDGLVGRVEMLTMAILAALGELRNQ